VDLDAVRDHMMLFYTGRPHHSGLNNWKIYKAFIEGSKDVRSALAEIGYIAAQTAAALQSGDWHAVGRLVDREWAQRRRLSTVVSTKTIDHIIERAREVQGSGKACGAGGGGCVLVWHDGDPATIATIREAAREVGAEELDWQPREKGCLVRKKA
jgi:D-glycero-alpha-D-manno-heptose-7-phosphate kinase